MSIEVYVHSRAGTQSDLRTGTVAEGPARVRLLVNGADPDLYPVIELGVGESLLIEVHEQVAGAPEQASPTRTGPLEPATGRKKAR